MMDPQWRERLPYQWWIHKGERGLPCESWTQKGEGFTLSVMDPERRGFTLPVMDLERRGV